MIGPWRYIGIPNQLHAQINVYPILLFFSFQTLKDLKISGRWKEIKSSKALNDISNVTDTVTGNCFLPISMHAQTPSSNILIPANGPVTGWHFLNVRITTLTETNSR